jgi:hypothetical protein
MRVVEKLAGVPAIYTGGARNEIAATLTQRGSVYGLIDVPTSTPSAPNGALFDAPVFWPSGLVDTARAAGAGVLLLTSHCDVDGRRELSPNGSRLARSPSSCQPSARASTRHRERGMSGTSCRTFAASDVEAKALL